MTDKTGGPAFPFSPSDNSTLKTCYGMTLRDYFAAQGVRSLPIEWSSPIPDGYFENVAKTAYAIADAMLSEREGIDKYAQMQREHRASAVQMQGGYESLQTLWEKKMSTDYKHVKYGYEMYEQDGSMRICPIGTAPDQEDSKGKNNGI
jgi:hypothetical protein